MGDVVFIAIVVAFFALMAGFVVACDRMIGPDDGTDLVGGEAEHHDLDAVDATDAAVTA